MFSAARKGGCFFERYIFFGGNPKNVKKSEKIEEKRKKTEKPLDTCR